MCSWRALCGPQAPGTSFSHPALQEASPARSPARDSRCARHLPAGFKILCLSLPAIPVGDLQTTVAQPSSRLARPAGSWSRMVGIICMSRETGQRPLLPRGGRPKTSQGSCHLIKTGHRWARQGVGEAGRGRVGAVGRSPSRRPRCAEARRLVRFDAKSLSARKRTRVQPGSHAPRVGRAALCQTQVQLRWVRGQPLLPRNKADPLLNLSESLHNDPLLE